jgi:hypothetical protein
MQLNRSMKFHLHLSAERETQVSILGTEEAFEQLAFRLTDALKARREPNSLWGSSLVTCDVQVVGRESEGMGLNFVIAPHSWNGMKSWRPAFGYWWSAALGLVGFASLAYAAFRLLF